MGEANCKEPPKWSPLPLSLSDVCCLLDFLDILSFYLIFSFLK
jgi:hypothetical protein